jgi:hypothetical protein
VSVVLDAFALTLFFTTDDDGIEWSGTHDGDEFRDAAVTTGEIDVFVTSGVDVRRAKPDELSAAASSRSMIGGRVTAHAVQTL